VPTTEPLPGVSTIDDGRLDKLAAGNGVTIAEIRERVGHQRLGRPPVTVDGDEAVRRYQAGESLPMVAKALGVSVTAVRKALIRAGVERRPPAACPAGSRPTTTLPSEPTPPGPPASERSGDPMTAVSLDRLAARLLDGADYAAATGEPITAEVLPIAASAAHQLAEREHTEAA
jgi:hypothetical protein